ncbi:MAG: hypothetical protein ACXVHR_09520 [Methanobacterium sp.]
MSGPRKDIKNPLIPGKPESKGNIIPFGNKYRKEIIAGAIAVLIALIIIIITSSGSPAVNSTNVTPQNQTVKMPTKIYSAGGIYLEYPATWNITTDEVNGKNMQIVIQDPASAKDPNSAQLVAFTILKVQKDPYQTLEQRKDVFIQSLANSGANIAPTNTTNTTVNGINATKTIYSGNGPKYEKIQLEVVYFEQNNIVYILAFLTKGIDLESQEQYLDVILNSFKLQ